MAKNISVIDMQGNAYEATYPKRAKGLVKKGRARFVNDFTICLAYPPYQTEENIMDMTYSETANSTAETSHEDNAKASDDTLSILQQVKEIVQDTQYIQFAFQHLMEMINSGFVDTAVAIGMVERVINSRETTNQRALIVLENLASRTM